MSQTIEDLVKERIDDMDIEGTVREYVKEVAHKQVTDAVRSAVLTKIDGIVAAAIEVEMKKPVVLSDGWGKIERHESFELFFRAVFAKKLGETWKMQDAIQRVVNERVNKLVNDHAVAAIQKVVDELTRK